MRFIEWSFRQTRNHSRPDNLDSFLVSREPAQRQTTLVEIRPGYLARVTGFGPEISPERRAQLLSYGVIPGRFIKVIQHMPVTILEVENTELALESGLARTIQVDRVE